MHWYVDVRYQQGTSERINNSQLPDVIWSALQEVFPVPLLPETESLHLGVVVSHGSIRIRRAVQVEVNELLQVRPHYLIGVDKDNFPQVHGEQDVKE